MASRYACLGPPATRRTREPLGTPLRALTRRAPVGLLVAALVMAFPGIAAHATYDTDDGRVLIIIGQQGEPVYTYQKTGLDLIIRANTTERPEIGGVDATLNATLLAPGGQTLALALQAQHGQVGRYTFVQGYTLTQPGLYKLRLAGTIDGSPVNGTYDMAHVILSQSDIMFPNKGLPTIQELDARADNLLERVAALEREMEHHDAMADDDEDGEAPGPGSILVLLAAAALVLLARRPRQA